MGTRRQQCLSIGDLIVVDGRLGIVLVHGAHLPYRLGSILHRVRSVGSLTLPLRGLGHRFRILGVMLQIGFDIEVELLLDRIVQRRFVSLNVLLYFVHLLGH